MYYVANVRFTDDSRKGAKQFSKEFLVEAVSITDAETTLVAALTEEDTILDFMAWEDFWWEVHEEVKRLGIQKEFDAQLEKMNHQDKHKYKDTRDRWSYALAKVKKKLKK